MPRILIMLFMLCAICSDTFAQQKLVEAAPESQMFSSERLMRIDNMAISYIEEGKSIGASALIIRNGKIIYHKAWGYDDKENQKPLKKDAIYRIASQTKAITSVAVMMLFEEGKFLLDEPVSKYIHSFKNPQVLNKFNPADTTYTTIPAKREVTIRDLLSHTSGIGYAQIGGKEATSIYAKNHIASGIGSGRASLAEDIQRLGSMPLMHQPGEKFTYGLNTDVLGYLVEVSSGMPLDSFFHKKIFEPLGMNDTYFYLPPEKQNRLVTTYAVDSTGKLFKAPSVLQVNGPIYTDYPKTNGGYLSGGAGLVSTLYDYAVFLQMLLNGGEYNGQRILSRHTVRMMTTNQIGDLDLGGNAFGLGFQVVTEKGSAKMPAPQGTFGWGGIFSTDYWVDPKEKIVALFYKQVWGDPAKEAAQKFNVFVYSALKD